MINQTIKDKINQKKQQNLYRQRYTIEPISSTTVLLEGSELVNFCSNDYLSLSFNPSIKKAYQLGFEKYPTGSGGSSLVSGFHGVHKQLEHEFAQYLCKKTALFLPCGYSANLSALAFLKHTEMDVVIDKSIHASIYDSLRLNQLEYQRYRHNDVAHLATKLGDKSVIITEGLFSMSGIVADIKAILSIKKNHHLIVDDAHAIGVLGHEGRGSIEYHGLDSGDIDILICPLGKAFASQGAIICGSEELIASLTQFARSFIYSTSPSPALSYGLIKTLEFVQAANDRRELLFDKIAYFKRLITISPWSWRKSNTPIQSLIIGDSKLAVDLSNFLRQNGIYCQAMRSPTVHLKDTGLRVTINHDHSFAQMEQFFNLLNQYYEITY
jgi:8-amino-7-oxononanoate synthase